MIKRGALLASALLALACATSMVPRNNTRSDIVTYVDRAADLVTESGPPACSTLSQPAWYNSDWYVFVFEVDGRVVCHPAQPSLVGTMQSTIVSPDGKHLGAEFQRAAASSSASGWVNYTWPRPGQTTPTAKSAYVRRVTAPDGKTYIVGAGGYEVQ